MKQIFLIIILFLIYGCEGDTEEDYLPSGISTRVHGNVFDSHAQEPIEGQKLIVSEYYFEFNIVNGGNDVYVQDVDSTLTDINGNFDFDFETAGMGTKYKIRPAYKENVWRVYQHPLELESIGGENQIDFDFIKLYKCNLEIALNEIDHPPFKVSIFPYHNKIEVIDFETGLYTTTVYLFPYYDEELKISRTMEDQTVETAVISIPSDNSLDETTVQIELTNEMFE